MKVDRVFLDTNVLISGLIFRGNEALILELANQGLIKLVVSDKVIVEAVQTFREKFSARMNVLNDFLSNSEYEIITLPAQVNIDNASNIVRDPNDAEVLACILISKPDFALTGDKDLLTEKVKKIAPVCRCADYLRSLTTNNREPSTGK